MAWSSSYVPFQSPPKNSYQSWCSSNICPSVEGSLGSILSRQHGGGPGPQLNLQQTLTPHALSSNPCVLSSSVWFLVHVERKANSLADDLSLDNLLHFFSQVPQAKYKKPPQVASSLLDILGYGHHIWTSTDWIKLFRNTIQQLWH